MTNGYLLVLFLINGLSDPSASGPYFLQTNDWQIQISEYGKIKSYWTNLPPESSEIVFRDDEYAGPAFEGVELSLENEEQLLFTGVKDDLKYGIQYTIEAGNLVVIASIQNAGDKTYSPKYARMILGLDTFMEKYPDWNYRFFPTMLRSEKTHFYGYAMSPLGRVFAFASPDPLASWGYEYNTHPVQLEDTLISRAGHRIHTVNLDLLHQLPLPKRHPQHLTGLKPGEKVVFRLCMKEISGLEELNDFVRHATQAPAIEVDMYTVAENEKICGKILSEDRPQLTVFAPQNVLIHAEPVLIEDGVYSFEFKTGRGVGEYKIVVEDNNGKITEAITFCRNPWSWYLNQARSEALECKPTSTHHAECFYPFYSYFLARKHLPNQEVDARAEEIFQQLFYELFDPEVKEMRNGKFRIQDAATMIGILTDRYQAGGDIIDMENAAGLVEFLMRRQGEDGAYYSGHNVHYTSVIYLAKSIMEYLVSANELAERYPAWKVRYNRHLESVTRALDDLARRTDNVQTEGEMTFEDGMISCSATQLAMGALRAPDRATREKYKGTSLVLTDKHRCLTLLKIPDSRMHGATLRFWEAQYTINIMHGMMNSPCGWSAWKTYGIWYQYLLTGDEEYLKLALNSLGAFMQLVDHKTGKLRFCFVPDPYIHALQFLETPIGSGKPEIQPVVLGEEYIDMMSYWHRYPHPTWREKWGIDNFVHEVFKCMEEIILTNAYVVEQSDGTFHAYNCTVVRSEHGLVIKSKEQLVDKLHVNLTGAYDIEFQSKTNHFFKEVSGLKWLGGTPDDIKVYEKMN